MNAHYSQAVRSEHASESPRELLKQDVGVLVGVDEQASSALELIDVGNVHDLATSPVFEVARSVYETAAAGDPSGGVDRTTAVAAAERHTEGDIADLANRRIDTLEGVDESTGSRLSSALGVKTVRDLAQWPPYRGARAILGALTGEGAETDEGVPEELVPMVRKYATEQTFYSRVYIDRRLSDSGEDEEGGFEAYFPPPTLDPVIIDVLGTSNPTTVASEMPLATELAASGSMGGSDIFAAPLAMTGMPADSDDQPQTSEHDRFVVLDPRDRSGETAYRISVTESIEPVEGQTLPPGVEVSATDIDVTEDSQVAGSIASGAVGFRFTGRIEDLSLTNPSAAAVFVDGTRWKDGVPLDRTLVLDTGDTGGTIDYELEVSETLEQVVGEQLPPGITVTRSDGDETGTDTASGRVENGAVGFRFAGDIERLRSPDGDNADADSLDYDAVDVYLDGEEIDYPSTLGRTEIDLSGSGRIDIEDTEGRNGFSTPAVGGVMQFSQKWVPQGLSLGQLLHSTTLAPGESTKVAVIDWSRRTSGQRQEMASQQERTQASMTQNRSISEVQDATTTELQKGRSHVSSESRTTQAGSTKQGGFNIGIISSGGSTSQSASTSTSSSTAVKSSMGRRNVHAETTQKIKNSTQQHASSSRTRRATVIRETEQEESEEVRTRVITNHNHMHALSVHYYEVVQIFRVEIAPEDVKPVLFVPFEPLDFSKRTSILKHRQALKRAALDGTTHHLLDIIASTEEDDYTPYSQDQRNRRILIEGTSSDESTTYELAVSGTLEPIDGETVDGFDVTFDDADSVTQTTAEGRVWGGTDGYRFSGEIAEFSLADESVANVYVDGVQREGKIEHDRTLVIDGSNTSGQTDYVFEAGSGVEQVDGKKLPPGVEVSGGSRDTVRGNTAEGRVSSGADGFVFSGPVENLEIDDPSAVTVYLDGEEWRATSEFTELVQRLQENRIYYSQAVWESMDSPELAVMLDDYDINGRPAAEFVDSVPEATHGNLVAFPLSLPESVEEAQDRRSARLAAWWNEWTDRNFNPEDIERDLVPLPTGGVHGESILGRANGAEKLDITRFWDWQESPIPQQAPQVAPIQTGSRASDQDLTDQGFDSPIVQMQQPQDLPDPTGVGAVLDTVGQNLFRDMSGMDAAASLAETTSQISGEGARHAADTAARTFEAASKARVEQSKTIADLVKSLASKGAYSASNAGNSSYGAMHNEAKKMENSKTATDALQERTSTDDGSGGGADGSSGGSDGSSGGSDGSGGGSGGGGETETDGGSMAEDALRERLGVNDTGGSMMADAGDASGGRTDSSAGDADGESDRSYIISGPGVSPERRAFNPSSNDKTGTIEMSVKVPDLPDDATIRWSVPPAANGDIGLGDDPNNPMTAQEGRQVTVMGLTPGLTEIDVAVVESSGTVIESVKYELCVPTFVHVTEQPAFDTKLSGYNLQSVKQSILEEIKRVCDWVHNQSNVRTVWEMEPFRETLPDQFTGGGPASGNVVEAELAGDPPQPTLYGRTRPPGNIGPNQHDEQIYAWIGAYEDRVSGNDNESVDEATNQAVLAVLNANQSSPDIQGTAIKLVGRLTGETLAHEIGHALIGPNLSGGFHNNPAVDRGIMNEGTDRSLRDRTGLDVDARSTTNLDNVSDNGIGVINIFQQDASNEIDKNFPVPPAFD